MRGDVVMFRDNDMMTGGFIALVVLGAVMTAAFSVYALMAREPVRGVKAACAVLFVVVAVAVFVVGWVVRQ